MKNVRTLFAIVLLLAVVPLYVQAQDRLLLRATLPFAFTVENTNLPAGSYTVYLVGSNDTMVRLQSADGRKVATVRAIHSQSLSDSKHSKLVFQRIGGEYFLFQMWEQGSDMHRDLVLGNLAHEMLAKNRTNQQVAGVVEIGTH